MDGNEVEGDSDGGGMVGLKEGMPLGSRDGCALGDVGMFVGKYDGDVVGLLVGDADGMPVTSEKQMLADSKSSHEGEKLSN